MADRINEYRLLHERGRGSTSVVYLAEVADEAAGLPLGTRVALKVFHPNVLSEGTSFDRFLREVLIGRTVEHPNVVRLLGVGATRGEPPIQHYIVMEYMHGKTLGEILEESQRCSEAFCLHVAHETAEGLAAIHAASIVHRDIKPDNLAIAKGLGRVRIMDLGIAQIQDRMLEVSVAGGFTGTLHYAAPEQLAQKRLDIDGRADLYALGIVLYELSTGRHPFADARNVLQRGRDPGASIVPPSLLNPALSPFFEQVVLTLTASDPIRRFATAQELAEVLETGESSAWWRARRRRLSESGQRPIRRLALARETKLYGREAEMEALQQVWRSARSGKGRVVLLRGEPGIGKSRLADELVGRLTAAGEALHYVLGSYPPGGVATATGAFVSAFREFLETEGLKKGVARYLGDRPVLQRAFEALLRGEPPPEASRDIGVHGLAHAFVLVVRRLAEKRPVIVHIEDLHLAPRAGLALFGALSQAVSSERVLLLGTTRPDLSQEWVADLARLESCRLIDVRRLEPDDIRGILAEATRAPLVASALAPRVSRFSDGNPFFVFELLRTLQQQGVLAPRADGSLRLERDVVDLPVPDRIADMIQARIVGVEESARELLDVAACSGHLFDPTLLAEVVDRPPLPVLQELSRLETEHRLVRGAGRRYAFDHHQIQEVLYALLSPLLREAYHDAIGQALERRIETEENPVARRDLMVDACWQLVRANRGARALGYLPEAMRHLAGGQLGDVALDLLDAFLKVPGLVVGARRAELLLQSGERLAGLGRQGEAAAAIEEARALLAAEPDPRLELEVECTLARQHQVAGRLEQARRHAVRALRATRRVGDKLQESGAQSRLGTIHEDLGHHPIAERCYRRSLELARRSGDREAEGKALGNLGGHEYRIGNTIGCVATLRRALAVFEACGADVQAGRTAGNIGTVLVGGGEYDEAQGHLERALRVARQSGNLFAEAKVIGNLGLLHFARGELDDARRCLEEDLNRQRELGDTRHEGLAHLYLAGLEHDLGRLDRARTHVEATLDIQRRTGYRLSHADALVRLARLETEWGDLERAEAHFFEALGGGALRKTDPRLAVVATTRLAELRHRRGDVDGARRLLEDLERDLDGPLAGEEATRARLVRARWKEEEREAIVRTALEEGWPRGIGDRLERAHDVWRLTDDPAHLEVAHVALETLRRHAPADARRTVVTNHELHRAVADAWAALQ